MKSSSKNLILSAACGIDPNSLNFFLKTLRNFYNGEVLFLINPNDTELKKKLDFYNCKYLEINDHKFDIQIKRYFHYLNFLKEDNYKRILLCDSRDIYFQADPFDYQFKGSINYFLESKKIGNCQYNSNWIVKTYGKRVLDNLSNKTIICSGTTLGDNYEIIKYLSLMIQQAENFKYRKRLKYFLTFRRDKEGRGSDQAYANYIAHMNLVENSFFYKNEDGPIATVFNLNNLIFNNSNQLVNYLNKPYAVVHQYDKKWDLFKDKINNFIKTLD